MVDTLRKYRKTGVPGTEIGKGIERASLRIAPDIDRAQATLWDLVGQREDGTIIVPEVLRKYMNTDIIE